MIRFPFMTCKKLKNVLQCNEPDQEFSSQEVLEALFFKAETPHRQRALALDDVSSDHKYMERTYNYQSIKVMEFEAPYPQCVLYPELKKQECTNLYPSGPVYSQAFHFGDHRIFVSVHYNMDQQSTFHYFGLFLVCRKKVLLCSLSIMNFLLEPNRHGELSGDAWVCRVMFKSLSSKRTSQSSQNSGQIVLGGGSIVRSS